MCLAPTSSWPSRPVPSFPRGVGGGSPPPHPRRWATPRLASGPPCRPQDRRSGGLGPASGWAGANFQGRPQPCFGHRPGSKEGRAGRCRSPASGAPQWQGIPKGWRPPPPLRPQGRIGKRDAPVPKVGEISPLNLSPKGNPAIVSLRPIRAGVPTTRSKAGKTRTSTGPTHSCPLFRANSWSEPRRLRSGQCAGGTAP